MSGEIPVATSLVLEPVYLAPPVLEDAGADPVLDETGNAIRDEKGNVIHGT